MAHLLTGVLFPCQLHTRPLMTSTAKHQTWKQGATRPSHLPITCKSILLMTISLKHANNWQLKLKIMACLLTGGLLPCQSRANMTTSLKASNKGYGLSSHWWPPSLPINVNMTTSLKASDKGCGLFSHWCPHSLPIKRKYDNQPQAIKGCGLFSHWCPHSLPIKHKYDNQPQGIKQRAWSVFSLVPSSPAHHTHS